MNAEDSSSFPKVSVLMAVYNTQEDHLRKAIESILAQNYDDFEFLIVNDASTDVNVERIIKSYSDPRIVYWVNEKNLGISDTRNRLIDLAKGEYLAVVDHDDVSYPDRLAEAVACLDQDPKLGVVSSLMREIDGVAGRIWNVPEKSLDIKKTLLLTCSVPHPASMIRKSVLIEHNIRYESMFSPSEDYALFCKLIDKTEFYNIQKVLLDYRNHRANTSHLQAKEMENTGIIIRERTRRENPLLWDWAKLDSMKKYRFKLFNFIPLVKIEETVERMNFYLFGFIPVFSFHKEKWRKK